MYTGINTQTARRIHLEYVRNVETWGYREAAQLRSNAIRAAKLQKL